MRLVILTVVLATLPINQSKSFNTVNKVECKSSLKSINNSYCFLKAYVRKYPLMNFGFTLNRLVPNGKVCLVAF